VINLISIIFIHYFRLMNIIFNEYVETAESLGHRIHKALAPDMEASARHEIFRYMLGLLDMTTLEGSDNSARVISLCEKAVFSRIDPSFPDAAAVCVYPSLVRAARKALGGSKIRIASVAGGFPAGQTSLNIKLEEVKWAIGEGSDEIDTVISRGKLMEGLDSEVYDEIAAIREACGNIRLKVILETGELQTVALVRKASILAISAGADFIKTSTGKAAVGATPEAFLIMLDTIREAYERTGKSIGIKPAGGIRTPQQSVAYFRLVSLFLGEDWLTSDFFRIGASSLADVLIAEISNEKP
jgi:deoxyribose-phosphate aldolase